MRAFKTLDAYFKPVAKQPDSGNAGLQRKERASNTTEVLQVDIAEAVAAPHPSKPTPAPPPPPPPSFVSAPPSTPSNAPQTRSNTQPSSSNPNAISTAIPRSTLPLARIPAMNFQGHPKSELLAEMLHGRRGGIHSNICLADDIGISKVSVANIADRGANIALLASPSEGCKPICSRPKSSSANQASRRELCTTTALRIDGDGGNGLQQRPRKRTCLPPPEPMERRPNLVCLLQARSTGRLLPGRELWWNSNPRLVQVGSWNAAEGLRPASVVHQDAVTQIEITSETDGRAFLAVAQANQRIRIVPYSVLRAFAEACRNKDREALEVIDGDREDSDSGDEQLDDSDVDRQRRRVQNRRKGIASQTLPWQELVDAGRSRYSNRGGGLGTPRAGAGAGSSGMGAQHGSSTWGSIGYDSNGGGGAGAAGSSSVLTLNTHSCVACLGWDPRRRGRLALVDRSSPSITILDLGWGLRGGGGSSSSGGVGMGGLTRCHLSVGSPCPGGAAARAMAYITYGCSNAPYTLAGAGRAGGEGAAVHLWDERRGSVPVSRLACPGGASLAARIESSMDGTALLGVVDPGTLVLWDVRRASSTAASSAVFSLGAAAPAPSAVVGSWDLQMPLAAVGCRRSVISSLAPDPQDASRTALLMQDGSFAVWSLASAAITHASPALTSPAVSTADTGGSALHQMGSSATMAAITTAPPASGSQQLSRPGSTIANGILRADAGELATYCRLGGVGVSGAWDADVCGFWHPAAVARVPFVNCGGDADADVGRGPGLVLTDCRMSCSAAAVVGSWTAAMGTELALPPGMRADAKMPLAAASPPPAVSVPLSDWRLCMVCTPETGDLVTGSLRGHLTYFWKA